MRFFKVDEYKLYEKYFEGMTAGEFLSLDYVPDGVETEQMKNITEFIKAEKEEFVSSGHDSAEVFDGRTITEIIMQKMVDSNEIDLEEAFGEATEHEEEQMLLD